MQTYRVFFEAMGGQCEIQMEALSEAQAHTLAQYAIDEIKRIESKYSRYRPDSVVSQIASQAGQDWVECDDETLTLLDHADRLFSISGGLFDITSGVLRRAWDFRRAEIPSDEALQVLCDLIDWPSVQREGRRVRLPKAGMELDFGGFGKEYAADLGAAVLLHRGVKQGYVNLAGDIRVVGPKIGNQPWIVGIQDPRNRDKLAANIAITSGGIATSGDYERYFELDGRRFCHILHPKNGQPVSFWRSVSVQASTALLAGSLATVAMLKQDQALEFLERQNVSYLAIDHKGVTHYNHG
jgi:thiamine biosynthesis lipoprotein